MDRAADPVRGAPAGRHSTTGLAEVARARGIAELTRAADERTRQLVDGFVHEAGPPRSAFAWVALGSHARGELHCASDQDHALLWDDDRAAASTYAADLAEHVIVGLERFGLRRCAGGYMADRWSMSVSAWTTAARARIDAPTSQAVLDTEVFLDVRALAGDLDAGPALAVLAEGSRSARLLHGLAGAAVGFPAPLGPFGRLPHTALDLKRGGLAPTVLLARLYGLVAGSAEVGTIPRLQAASEVLGDELSARLVQAFATLTRLRLERQLRDSLAGLPLTDTVDPADLSEPDRQALRDALRAVRAAQSVTAVRFRTDL
jgi:CBS domain-containing protein